MRESFHSGRMNSIKLKKWVFHKWRFSVGFFLLDHPEWYFRTNKAVGCQSRVIDHMASVKRRRALIRWRPMPYKRWIKASGKQPAHSLQIVSSALLNDTISSYCLSSASRCHLCRSISWSVTGETVKQD